MRQTTERRGDARKPAAFTLWYQRSGRTDWLGGWAMNICSGGLAAIVPPDESPRLGEVVRLVPLTPPSPTVADALPTGLPSAGRVIRVDSRDGLTRRIAIAFEAEVPAGLDPGQEFSAAAGVRPDVASKPAGDLIFAPRSGSPAPPTHAI